jgi:hypothetical protein
VTGKIINLVVDMSLAEVVICGKGRSRSRILIAHSFDDLLDEAARKKTHKDTGQLLCHGRAAVHKQI